MTRQQAFGIIGVWMVLLPLLGIPNAWKLNLMVLTGAVVLVLYWNMRKESQASPAISRHVHGADFVENTVSNDKETDVSLQ
jgi:heme A synthase